MKEIYAVIRPNKIGATKEALAILGFPGMTAVKVVGRGKQRGILGEVSFNIDPELLKTTGGMKYVPKRLVYLVVDDADVPLVVAVIIKINRTGQIGDGRIFVCPVEEAVRVRTGERGKEAI
ncbi:nitrogen fixation protein NifHD [Desulfofundulus thermobenzoicus]|uniref:Nitrogen fixation protein NifHD n=1 Tax=Desulfofundulus thermobenzoicus TaxID=29376 RepID=A0A6N7ITL7_9FIRM|nr:nitrogen fixation protein NifHD [Desulfofundulus thermobenzoicus]HHW45104.1 P-II family nitrogen regulator [Desulfotomaculum sp.]